MATDGYVQIIWDAPEWNPWAPRLVVHDVSTTPPVLAAELAQAWADIQRHHPELPDLAAPESLIGESSSACGAELSFERLLHEAVHGIAASRGVRDTSRAGRYHNRRFLAIAEELGLDHPEEPHPSSGFSLVTLNPEARKRYRPTIERLQRALKAHTAATAADTARSFRGPAARHGSSGGGVRVKAVCDCGRNVRVVPSVLAQAPIVCGGCGKPFRIPEVVGAAMRLTRLSWTGTTDQVRSSRRRMAQWLAVLDSRIGTLSPPADASIGHPEYRNPTWHLVVPNHVKTRRHHSSGSQDQAEASGQDPFASLPHRRRRLPYPP